MDDSTLIIIFALLNIAMWIVVFRWMIIITEFQNKMSKKQMEYYHQASQLNANLADELSRSMNLFIEEIREVNKDLNNGKVSFKENRG